MCSDREHVTRRELDEAIATINERIDSMPTQTDIDAITTELGTVSTDLQKVSTDLATSTQTIQAEIDKLAAANPTLDITALQAAAAALDPAVQTLDQAAAAVGTLAPQPTDTSQLARTVYMTTNATVDATAWPAAGYVVPGTTPPEALYYYTGDTAPGQQNGAGDAGWTVYTGPIEPAPAG